MISKKNQIVFRFLKTAGLVGDAARTVGAAGRGFLTSGKHISNVMAEHGVQSSLAHGAAKAAPYLVAAAGAKSAWESDPVQRLRYRYHMYKQRKAMERAQRGY